MGERHNGGERIGGYFVSALIFAAITAAWAYIVRRDDFYQWTELLGTRLPIATVLYLIFMPLAGFWGGRWRYQANEKGGGVSWLAKVFARSLHFLYTHILIVLFTFAMMTDYFLGWNIDDSVREIDDGLFDIAARFAPWLSAYLAGFNLGRVWGISTSSARRSAPGSDRARASTRSRLRQRGEPGKSLLATRDGEIDERWPSEEEIVFADDRRRRKFFPWIG